MILELDVQYATNEISKDQLPKELEIEQWVRIALEEKMDAAQLSVRIVDSDEIRTLNKTYRHRNSLTNVLSFSFEMPDKLVPPLIGDVVLCAAEIAREAQQQGKSIKSHWAHLVTHGVLHLIGFKHDDDKNAGIMETQEKIILARLGFSDPYVINSQLHGI